MWEDFFNLILKSYGLAGVLILLPVVSTVFLWLANNKLQAQSLAQSALAIEAQKSRVEDQGKRVADTERMMTKLLDVVKEQTALGAETNAVLERLSISVDKLERHALTNGKNR